MTAARKVHDQDKHIHFVTFSCFKRRQLLNTDQAKRIVIGSLANQLQKLNGLCPGFVIMPNHVHALVWFPDTEKISLLMNMWKSHSSRQIKQMFHKHFPAYLSQINPEDPVWQSKYYGFNIFSEKKAIEKLDYMHLNPVRAGLVKEPCEWKWSSARKYGEGKSVGIEINWPPGFNN